MTWIIVGLNFCSAGHAINKNHYAPKFDGSEPSKCSNCGSRVHFPEDGPFNPHFINQ